MTNSQLHFQDDVGGQLHICARLFVEKRHLRTPVAHARFSSSLRIWARNRIKTTNHKCCYSFASTITRLISSCIPRRLLCALTRRPSRSRSSELPKALEFVYPIPPRETSLRTHSASLRKIEFRFDTDKISLQKRRRFETMEFPLGIRNSLLHRSETLIREGRESRQMFVVERAFFRRSLLRPFVL